MNRKEEIIQLMLKYGILGINFKEYTLFNSGIKSPLYFDFRHCREYWDLTDLIVSEIKDKFIRKDTNVIMGVYTGAAVFSETLRDRTRIPSAYVRPDHKTKNYGLGKIIEGCDVQGKNVVLIEDVISSGKSVIEVAKIIRDCGAHRISIRPIFTYLFKGTKDVFEKEYFYYRPLLTIYDIIPEIKKIITPEQSEILDAWVKEHCE